MLTIDVEALYRRHGDTARLELLERYEREALELAGRGAHVLLTGRAPIWLYLRLAHALHGVARRLTYENGPGDRIEIFDHPVR
jgi:hypothetical protein